MTTVADISLQIAKLVTDVLEGTATQGSSSSLADTVNLIQQSQYYDKGSLWIRSGTYDGRVIPITGFADNEISFDPLPTAICAQQVETATVVGTVTGSGNATVIVTAAILPGSPKTYSVAVLNLDTASQVATKIRTAFNADSDLTSYFTVGGTGALVTLTAKTARANDTTLNTSIANGTCTGLTAAPTSANTTAGVAGPRYAVIRNAYPWPQFIQALTDALDETHVTGEDDSLTGDGETLEFDLPAGVSDVKYVELERTSIPGYQPVSMHWDERLDKLRFSYGYAPEDEDIIHVFYRTPHDELAAYNDEISTEIHLAWLKNKGAEKLLTWAMPMYAREPDYRIEERMNIVLNNLKGKHPRVSGPDLMMHTAGG